MREIKTFQVRDSGTHIPVMCVRVVPDPDEKQFLRAGFRNHPSVLLTNLNTMETNYDWYNWSPPRTLKEAHGYISDNWTQLSDGAVIDIEFLLEETTHQKEAE